MKKIIPFVLLTLVACSRGTGRIEGRLVDVSWEGTFINSCEIDIQYGDQSSRIERLSSREKGICDNLMRGVGKKYSIEYHREFWSWTTESSDILTSYLQVP